MSASQAKLLSNRRLAQISTSRQGESARLSVLHYTTNYSFSRLHCSAIWLSVHSFIAFSCNALFRGGVSAHHSRLTPLDDISSTIRLYLCNHGYTGDSSSPSQLVFKCITSNAIFSHRVVRLVLPCPVILCCLES